MQRTISPAAQCVAASARSSPSRRKHIKRRLRSRALVVGCVVPTLLLRGGLGCNRRGQRRGRRGFCLLWNSAAKVLHGPVGIVERSAQRTSHFRFRKSHSHDRLYSLLKLRPHEHSSSRRVGSGCLQRRGAWCCWRHGWICASRRGGRWFGRNSWRAHRCVVSRLWRRLWCRLGHGVWLHIGCCGRGGGRGCCGRRLGFCCDRLFGRHHNNET
mmetsp:Transcript_14699/g.39356  ORF Transcript_14699/g.39356 Transcript_14699/m.39356 type:complete len:213 (-) Transcript_14699:214-852(-)